MVIMFRCPISDYLRPIQSRRRSRTRTVRFQSVGKQRPGTGDIQPDESFSAGAVQRARIDHQFLFFLQTQAVSSEPIPVARQSIQTR